MEDQHRYPVLDSLRGLAALQVLLMHYLDCFNGIKWITLYEHHGFHNVKDIWFYIFYSPLNILWAGHPAVILFFVLSGFVLSLSHFSGKNTLKYRTYFLRRITRLYIPCLILVLIVFVCHAILYEPNKIEGFIPLLMKYWDVESTQKSFVKVIFLIDNFYVPQMWTIPIEIKLSLLLPLFLFFHKKVKNLWSILSLPLFIVCYSVLVKIGLITSIPFLKVLYHFSFFIAGAILCRHRLKAIAFANSLKNLPFILFIALAVVLYTSATTFWFLPEPFFKLVLKFEDYLVMIAAVILMVAVMSNKLKGVFNAPILVKLGKISFSVYLTHMATISFGVYLLYPLIKDQNLTLIIVSVFIFPISLLFYKWVEKPSIALSKKVR